MSTPLKHSENQKKHLTKAERAARRQAESGMECGKRAYLRAPGWLSSEARKIFNTYKKRLRGYELLEAVDIDLLAMMADALAKYQAGQKTLTSESDVKEIQALQAWSRIAMVYADKLGISATARARLARRRAIETPPDDMERLLSDVTNYVNEPK